MASSPSAPSCGATCRDCRPVPGPISSTRSPGRGCRRTSSRRAVSSGSGRSSTWRCAYGYGAWSVSTTAAPAATAASAPAAAIASDVVLTGSPWLSTIAIHHAAAASGSSAQPASASASACPAPGAEVQTSNQASMSSRVPAAAAGRLARRSPRVEQHGGDQGGDCLGDVQPGPGECPVLCLRRGREGDREQRAPGQQEPAHRERDQPGAPPQDGPSRSRCRRPEAEGLAAEWPEAGGRKRVGLHGSHRRITEKFCKRISAESCL